MVYGNERRKQIGLEEWNDGEMGWGDERRGYWRKEEER